MTYTIAVSNEKGGVAKTTTVLSLGAALAERGLHVLLIDLDPQANLTLALGMEPAENDRTSAHVLIEAAPLLSARRKTDIPNLDLVPSSHRMGNAEQFLPMRTNYYRTLKNALAASGPLPYDFVIADCPPALGSVTTNAIAAADLLIIPTQAEFFSAYALRNMMALVRRVRQESNPRLAYRILITQLDRRNRVHRNIQQQLRETFGKGVFETVIEIDTKLRESPIAGAPITLYKPNSRGATQYRALAQEIIEYAKETKEEAIRQSA
ncbi:MAG: ParA family protein [Anaerolineae bacterium]|nr:MAG: ParA family protein [Anaerolineae bacterium]